MTDHLTSAENTAKFPQSIMIITRTELIAYLVNTQILLLAYLLTSTS